jgi:CBS domain-containing protein
MSETGHDDTQRHDVFTKETPIGRARSIAEAPCIVFESDPLPMVADAISRQRGVHTAAVVDQSGKLVGILPLRLLVDELFFQVAPEEFLREIMDLDRIEQFGRVAHARTAGDLMEAPVYVTVEDSFGDAFACMHEHNLDGLPVVDGDERPIGYLDRFELIKVWLQQHQQQSG